MESSSSANGTISEFTWYDCSIIVSAAVDNARFRVCVHSKAEPRTSYAVRVHVQVISLLDLIAVPTRYYVIGHFRARRGRDGDDRNDQ